MVRAVDDVIGILRQGGADEAAQLLIAAGSTTAAVRAARERIEAMELVDSESRLALQADWGLPDGTLVRPL